MDADSERLAEYLVALFEANTGVDLRIDETAMKRVHEVAEAQTKLWRKYFFAVEVNLPFLGANADGPIHFEETIAGARAKRVFAGEDYTADLAAAREEREQREREAEEKRAKEDHKKWAREEEERAERKQDFKIVFVSLAVIVALAAAVIAFSSRHHEDQDRKEHSTEHH